MSFRAFFLKISWCLERSVCAFLNPGGGGGVGGGGVVNVRQYDVLCVILKASESPPHPQHPSCSLTGPLEPQSIQTTMVPSMEVLLLLV